MSPAAAAVLVPLVGAVLALLAGGRSARWVGVVAGAGTLAAALALVRRVWENGAERYPIGGWGAPLGIDYHVDGLAAALVATAALIGLSVIVYALGYFSGEEERPGWGPHAGFWPLLLLLWASLNSLFLSHDLFNLYVGLEMMTVAAVALVVLEQERVAIMAGMRYLLAAVAGSIAYLMGVALLYGEYHVLDVSLLAERVQANASTWMALGLIAAGLAVKSALFPLHFWLPRAHAAAPAPASAVLSGLVVTASFYVLLRIWFGVLPATPKGPAAQLLGAAGAAAIVWGSLQAIRQQRLKLMVAYSTVAQVGYLFLVFPLADATPAGVPRWAADAWSGGAYYAISHALAKAAMFLAAGTIAHSLGNDRIAGIRGISAHLPVTTYAFGIAGITLIGVPPTGGFAAKWLLLSAAVASGEWWWAAVIVVGGLLTAGYVFQMLTQDFYEGEEGEEPRFSPVPRVMEYATMLLALCALAAGLRAAEPLLLLRMGSPLLAGGGGE